MTDQLNWSHGAIQQRNTNREHPSQEKRGAYTSSYTPTVSLPPGKQKFHQLPFNNEASQSASRERSSATASPPLPDTTTAAQILRSSREHSVLPQEMHQVIDYRMNAIEDRLSEKIETIITNAFLRIGSSNHEHCPPRQRGDEFSNLPLQTHDEEPYPDDELLDNHPTPGLDTSFRRQSARSPHRDQASTPSIHDYQQGYVAPTLHETGTQLPGRNYPHHPQHPRGSPQSLQKSPPHHHLQQTPYVDSMKRNKAFKQLLSATARKSTVPTG